MLKNYRQRFFRISVIIFKFFEFIFRSCTVIPLPARVLKVDCALNKSDVPSRTNMSEITTESREKGKSLQPLRALVPFIAPYKGVLIVAIFALIVSEGFKTFFH